jgi:hypothetical protein
VIYKIAKLVKYLFLLLAGAFLLSASCRKANKPQPEYPCCVDSLIQVIMSEPVSDPPRKIYQYTYHGQPVYFVPQYCCDNFSDLYDCEGNIICHPDGGITGRGDGKCSDFFEKRKDEKLIWEDNRK